MPIINSHLKLVAATVVLFCSVAPAAVAAPANAPLVKSKPDTIPSVLFGIWQDRQKVLLPPGITIFEVFDNKITFAPDGSFTQFINTATGPLRQTGSYTVQGSHLTLNFSGGSGLYDFTHTSDSLMLRSVGHSKMGALILSAVLPAALQAKPASIAMPNASGR